MMARPEGHGDLPGGQPAARQGRGPRTQERPRHRSGVGQVLGQASPVDLDRRAFHPGLSAVGEDPGGLPRQAR